MRQEAGTGRERLTELDALRGLAALAVLLNHAVQIAPRMDHPAIPGVGFLRYTLTHLTPLRVIEFGRPAVLFFFVLSGYVLTRALLRSGSPGLGAFAAQRTIRLGVPVLASVLLSVGLWWAFADPVLPEEVRARSLYTWLEPPTPWQVVSNALLIGDSDGMRLNIVLWSLVHEWRLTLLLPLVLLFRGRVAPFLALAVLATWFGILAGAGENHAMLGRALHSTFASTLYFVGAVGAGVALALRCGDGVPALGRGARIAGGVACVALFGMASDIAVYLGSVLLIVLARQPGRFRDMLRAGPFAWLGNVSFSLYLVHVPVLVAVLHLLHGAWPGLLVAAVGTLLALGAAVPFFHLVEAPSRRLGRLAERRLARREAARAAPSPAGVEPAGKRDWAPEGGMWALPR